MAVIGFSMVGCGDTDLSSPGGGDPTLTGSVSISPFVKVGVEVTANTTNLDGTGTLTYKWMLANAVDGTYMVTGTNNASYTPEAADENKFLLARTNSTRLLL